MELNAEGVGALAPDAKAAAGRKLAVPAKWQGLGRGEGTVWGEHRGSALCQVSADLSDLSAKCSCPSRKLPRKHSLGLLFLAAEGALAEAPPPDWVSGWLARRAAKKGAEHKRAAGDAPADSLKNYLPGEGTIVPEKLVGHARRRKSAALRDVILCVDQSGSMATSIVYSGIFGAVLASIRAVATRMVVFDTAVVDLTEDLQDPVDLLFGTRLGGGTDINRALAYCAGLVRRPTDTILVLVTDLYEGGDREEMLKRVASLVASGVKVICFLALNDSGAPAHDERNASAMTSLGIPAFACTPDLFSGLMAAIQGDDLALWAARNDIVVDG